MSALLKRLVLAFGLAAVAALVGCAHPITINPDVAKVTGSGAPRIDKSVAYYVSIDDMKREVITAGGGGDKISYFPYRDLDTAIYKSLSEVYTNVTKLETPIAADSAKNAHFVFTPQLTTTSSSSSPFTWPATDFTVELACKVTDSTGKSITDIVVTGNGKAEFSEFKSDFGLSARRASQDALVKFTKAIETSPQLR